ncbi:MAG: internal scaffolding protein [Microviridae sp.]|nr:MAG: internal scaffolding protein [Microviridae sp.]
MSKVKTREPRSFYVPHARVQFTGELVDHRTGEVYTPPRRVKQSFVAECDINTILKQFSSTGQLTHVRANSAAGHYANLPDNIDFQESMNIIKQSETAFASLPARVRDRFGNDPAAFLEFMADPNNQDEAIRLGLMTKRPEPEAAPSGGGNRPPEPPQATTTAPAAPEPPKGS